MASTKFEEHEFSFANGEKKTSYLAAGPRDGPLLIFIHGWPAIGKTWKHQLTTFSSLGFRCIAPDMPGYGKSSSRRITTDYSLEEINNSMLALLAHLERDAAIWIGHDWGCGAVWSLAAVHPEACTAVCAMAVPAHTIELGLEELVKYVDRDLYPAEGCWYGQWDYQRFYQLEFERAHRFHDADPAAFLRVVYSRGNPSAVGKPTSTSEVVKNGGWFGGMEKPDARWREVPIERTCIDEELYGELVEAMERTGFFGANSWYDNHDRNRQYFLDKAKNGGYLHMPALFIEAKFDTICDTANSRLAEPQRKFATDLTETTIDAGHWIPQEKPAEVNAALTRWLMESCKGHWPGYWSRRFVKAPAQTPR